MGVQYRSYDNKGKEMSRQQFKRLQIYITDDQRLFLEQDADARYPEIHGPTGQRRNLSPAIRDMIDFAEAQYSLFLSHMSSRRQITQESSEATQ